MSDDLKTALEDLIHSPGWLAFREHVRKEWGAVGYAKKIENAIATNAGTLTLAPEVEKIHATTREIMFLMDWPDRELKTWQPKPVAPVSMQRGGR